jgi:anhydro-N-acetylmuramic acid kinase
MSAERRQRFARRFPAPMPGDRYAGVMSGTSLDGVDAVVADFGPTGCRVLGFATRPFPSALRDELLVLQARAGDEIARAARAANALADLYAEAIRDAAAAAGIAPGDLAAAGVHGQTIRHRPEEGWTLQLNNPARVAEGCGATVIADFRSRDVAAGGQGAPLVPVFHAAAFGGARHRAIVNVGGIANVTDLPPGGIVRGFDTGPGNVLLDLWHARHRGGPYDADGAWAQGGNVDAALLEVMLAEPFLALPPPRSTGRELFNAGWLDDRLAGRALAAVDVQATLLAFTARCVAGAIGEHCGRAQEVLVCGGGARNAALMARLAALLAPRPVATTAAAGYAPEHVEALAFAWLAREALAGRPGNLPAVTGAAGRRILGAIYPA